MTAALVVVGVSHKTAPVSLLERFAIGDDDLPKALDQVATLPHVIESAILSTCNRTEIYALVSKFHGGVQDVRNFLAEFCHVAPEDFADHLYDFHDDAAARHLFSVAAGVESLVVGESEILGQVRRAGRRAAEAGAAGRRLGGLFEAAGRAGKRARAETSIGREAASVSTAAVALARATYGAGGLQGRRVLLVGAGKMGRNAARALTGAGATLILTNRTPERGRALADELHAELRPFDALENELSAADVAICSTAAPGFLLDVDAVARAVAARSKPDPLLIIDIAVPRQVDPSVTDVEGIILRDIDDLRAVVRAAVETRLRERPRVESIIEQEMERLTRSMFGPDERALAAEIVREVDCIRRKELERLEAVVPGLSDDVRRELERMSKRLVARAVHAPLSKARLLGPRGPGSYTQMLAELYGLSATTGDAADEEE